MAAEPQHPCEAAPHLSPLAHLTTLLSLLPLLRSVENPFLPAVLNEGLWSCVPIPGGLCFKGHPFAWLCWEAGTGGWELIKHLQKGLNYRDVFPLKFFLLDDLVYLFRALCMKHFQMPACRV